MEDTGIYNEALAGLLGRTFDWTADPVKVVLLGADYVFDPEHTASDIRAHRCGESALLTGQHVEGRSAFADPTFLLATKDVRCGKVAAVADDFSVLVACVPIAAVLPVRGQRIDIKWSPSGVFAL